METVRINVYAEELTGECEIVKKEPANHPGVAFYGVRMFLASPSELHHSAEDDDRSAVTFWVPWTRKEGLRPNVVSALFLELMELAESLPSGQS